MQKPLTLASTLLLVTFLGPLSASTSSASPRFAVDPSVDLNELARTGEIAVNFTSQEEKTYVTDASAVISVPFTRLWSSSIDFDRYVEMGMPNLQESRVVSRAGDVVVTWSHMKTRVAVTTVASKHYLEVREHRSLGNSSAGTEWQLTAAHPGWPYEEDSAFSELEGSWFMKDLGNGSIYVRYFIHAQVNSRWPSSVVKQVAKSQFRDGVPKVIQALVRDARGR